MFCGSILAKLQNLNQTNNFCNSLDKSWQKELNIWQYDLPYFHRWCHFPIWAAEESDRRTNARYSCNRYEIVRSIFYSLASQVCWLESSLTQLFFKSKAVKTHHRGKYLCMADLLFDWLDLIKHVWLLLIHYKQSSWIQAKYTRGRSCNYT